MVKNYAVETEGISKIYRNNTIGIKNINLKIRMGEMVAITGPSGSGKTTLLNILGGLDIPDEGTVKVCGTNINELPEEGRTDFRRKNIGFIFQDFNLIPVLNVYENIMLPVELEHASIEERVVDLTLKGLGIEDKKYDLPSQLSGGQQQRVAIARALVMRPGIILADEPTGNLDRASSDQVVEILKTISEKGKQTVIIITHDNDVARRCNRIVRIEDGMIREKR